MADNISAPATGVSFATDDIGGTHYPRSKVVFGVNGVATDVSADAPLPVAIISGAPGGAGDASAANQDEQTAILADLLAALIATITVDGEVSLSSATLTALETTELGAATLAALETIAVTGTVELGATTLAALETTELGAATLAALENITVSMSGAVELGASTVAALGTSELGPTTLAALENITAIVTRAQGTPAHATETLAAATAKTILAPDANRIGARILNFTPAPVYLTPGTTGTPASGGGADYVPAAASGVPGQWESPYRPVGGIRAIGASAGDLTVVSW